MIQKEFIRNELKYRYPDLYDHIAFAEQNVGRPLMFEYGNRKFGAHIIIASAENMLSLQDSDQNEALFLILGRPNESVLSKYDVCVLPSGEQMGAVFNFVQRLFDRLDDWKQTLREAAETGEGASGLLFRASTMLQNPVYLLDGRGHTIASHDQTSDFQPEPWMDDPSFQNRTRLNGHVQKITRTGFPEFLLCDFHAGERPFTLICIASERPLYASDEMVFDSLAGFLRLMLSERTLHFGATRKSRDTEAAAGFLREMLLQKTAQPTTIEALKELGWSELDAYSVISLEPKNQNLFAAQADMICDQVEAAFDGCCAFTLLPAIFAIVRTELVSEPEMLIRLTAFAGERQLNVGVCEAYDGFEYLSQRREQSLRAMNRAAQQGSFCTYAELFEEEFAKNAIGDFAVELMCLRSIRAMAKYDRIHGTNYLTTAEHYVKNRFNAVKTAGELFIHRSTFLYRLERIREQFGLNIDDPDCSIFHLSYSFLMVRR